MNQKSTPNVNILQSFSILCECVLQPYLLDTSVIENHKASKSAVMTCSPIFVKGPDEVSIHSLGP